MKRTSIRAVAALSFALLVAAFVFSMPATTNAAPLTPQQSSSQLNGYQGGFCTVTVQRGEALYMIAARFHTTTAYIASINNLYNPNYIYAGMVLKVPCNQPNPYPQPQPYPQPGKYPICTYYTVRPGDWLKTIAIYFGVSWQALAQANGLYNPNYIYVGQRLAIPCAHPYPPPVCPGCPPCQGCPPVYPTPPNYYPTPVPICPGCPPVCPGCPCQGCPPIVYPTPVPICPGCPPVCPGCPCQGCPPIANNVEIRDDYFAPSVITIHQYQWVQWVNKGNKVHSVTQGLCPGGQCTPTPGGFNSGPMNPGAAYSFQFYQLGTFAYFDQASGQGATVAVVP